MRVTKLLSYAISGTGLFFFGFTLAALWYEPAIDVLGIIVQFLLVFVGLLGIDEWYRQFKFKNEWEMLQMELKKLEELKTLTEKCKQAILELDTYIGSSYIVNPHSNSTYNLDTNKIRQALLSAATYSKLLEEMLSTLDFSLEKRPSHKELRNFSFDLKNELIDFDSQVLAETVFALLEYKDDNTLAPKPKANQQQKRIGDFLNKYGAVAEDWPLINSLNTKIRQENSKINSMGN